MRMMRVAGHQEADIREIKGCDHSGMVAPSFPLLMDEVHRIVKQAAGQ